MITPEVPPTGATHGTPTLPRHCRPPGHPRPAPDAGPLRLQPRPRRPGLLLGGPPRPARLLGLPPLQLADPPAPPAAPLRRHHVAPAALAGGARAAGRAGAPGRRAAHARGLLGDRRQAPADRRRV